MHSIKGWRVGVAIGGGGGVGPKWRRRHRLGNSNPQPLLISLPFISIFPPKLTLLVRLSTSNPDPPSTHHQLGYDPPEELLGVQREDAKSRNVVSKGVGCLGSWFGPNGQYIKELPCPSCRGRGYTPCSGCGVDRPITDCPLCSGKGITTCSKCLGDCVVWEESIDEQPWEKARSSSPLKVKEDDEVDKLDIKLDHRKSSNRVYESLPPEVALKISRSLKSLNAKTGLFTKRMKLIHRDRKLRAERAASIRKAKGTPVARKRISEATTAYFSNPENRLKHSAAMKGVKFFCKHCGREGHRKHSCPELKDTIKVWPHKCRLCGEPGHNKLSCPEAKKSGVEAPVRRKSRCKKCGQIGHNSRTCPQVTVLVGDSGDANKTVQTSRRRSSHCRLCGQKGHTARTCSAGRKQLNVSNSLDTDDDNDA